MSSVLDVERCDDSILGLLQFLDQFSTTIDRDNLIPSNIIEKLIEEKIFVLETVSLEEFLCRVRALAQVSPAIAHSLLVHASAWLAAGKLKTKPREILALSVTEPGGGTDIRASLKTVANHVDGEWLVNGVKIFTSNAPYASRFVVLANAPSGPTIFTVEKTKKVSIELLDIIGLRGTGASIVEFREAEAELIGTPGKGIKESLKGINLGRLGYGAIALGIIDSSLSIIIKTSKNKIIFGKPLIEYQGIKWRIAEIYMNKRSLESLIEAAIIKSDGTWIIDPEIAAIVKVLAAEAAQKAAWAATQIMGGKGLQRWSKTERMQRDARALDIGEGAREVLLDYISSKAIKSIS